MISEPIPRPLVLLLLSMLLIPCTPTQWPAFVQDHPRCAWGGIGAGDSFGASICITPDQNSDGWLDLIVGVPYHEHAVGGGVDNGAVYRFSGRTPTQYGDLYHTCDTGGGPVPWSNAHLGLRVGCMDDQDGDGIPDLFATVADDSTCDEGVSRLHGGASMAPFPSWTPSAPPTRGWAGGWGTPSGRRS